MRKVEDYKIANPLNFLTSQQTLLSDFGGMHFCGNVLFIIMFLYDINADVNLGSGLITNPTDVYACGLTSGCCGEVKDKGIKMF